MGYFSNNGVIGPGDQIQPPVPCTTQGCPGDGRYAAPGKGHLNGCRYPHDNFRLDENAIREDVVERAARAIADYELADYAEVERTPSDWTIWLPEARALHAAGLLAGGVPGRNEAEIPTSLTSDLRDAAQRAAKAWNAIRTTRSPYEGFKAGYEKAMRDVMAGRLPDLQDGTRCAWCGDKAIMAVPDDGIGITYPICGKDHTNEQD